MVATQRYCTERRERGDAPPGCELMMDVLVSERARRRAAAAPAKRYQLMRANKDFRAALAREQRRIQGRWPSTSAFAKARSEMRDSNEMATKIDLLLHRHGRSDQSSVPGMRVVAHPLRSATK